MLEKEDEAQRLFDEKWLSICRVVKNYYKTTFKDVARYAARLPRLDDKSIDEICVIGHSLAGVDRYYFSRIDSLTNRKLIWKVYYYRPDEKEKLKNNLIDAEIDAKRIIMISSAEFYDL
jgi:hypothetical protein